MDWNGYGMDHRVEGLALDLQPWQPPRDVPFCHIWSRWWTSLPMVFRTRPTCQGCCLKLPWLCRTHETLWKFVGGSLFKFCVGRMSSKRCEPLQLWPWQHWLRCGWDELLPAACHSYMLQLPGCDALWYWGLRYGATTIVEGFPDCSFAQQTLWLIDLTCVCDEPSLKVGQYYKLKFIVKQ